MFFNGSRYLKVKNYVVSDDQGREVKVKAIRPIEKLAGEFVYQVKEGDRLDLLAFKFYRTPRKWWMICDANPGLMYTDDYLEPGRKLTIPKDKAL